MQLAPESCLRCGAAMDWRHQTWQCPRCRFKLGCCEGETGECPPAPGAAVLPRRMFDAGRSSHNSP